MVWRLTLRPMKTLETTSQLSNPPFLCFGELMLAARRELKKEREANCRASVRLRGLGRKMYVWHSFRARFIQPKIPVWVCEIFVCRKERYFHLAEPVSSKWRDYHVTCLLLECVSSKQFASCREEVNSPAVIYMTMLSSQFSDICLYNKLSLRLRDVACDISRETAIPRAV